MILATVLAARGHRLVVVEESGRFELRCYECDPHGTARSGMPVIVRSSDALPPILKCHAEAVMCSALGLHINDWALQVRS